MVFLRESAMTSQRVRELGPPFVAPRRAVLRPCVGSSKSRLKSCVQRLAGFLRFAGFCCTTFVSPCLAQPSIGGGGGGCAGATSLAQPQNRSLKSFLKLFLKLERDFLKLYSRKTSCKV